jgi:hypothetical protein
MHFQHTGQEAPTTEVTVTTHTHANLRGPVHSTAGASCPHKSLRHLLPMTGDDGWLQHDLSAAGGARVTEQQPPMKQPFGLSFLQPHTAQCT